jgi:hypothetical protein
LEEPRLRRPLERDPVRLPKKPVSMSRRPLFVPRPAPPSAVNEDGVVAMNVLKLNSDLDRDIPGPVVGSLERNPLGVVMSGEGLLAP